MDLFGCEFQHWLAFKLFSKNLFKNLLSLKETFITGNFVTFILKVHKYGSSFLRIPFLRILSFLQERARNDILDVLADAAYQVVQLDRGLLLLRLLCQHQV